MSSVSDPPAPGKSAAQAPPAVPPPVLDRWRYAGVFLLLFLFGTETFLISPLLPTIADSVGVREAEAASSVTAYVLVYALAAPFLGLLSDRLGRRRTLLAGALLFVLSNGAAALSTGLTLLVVSRAVAGLAAAAAGPAIWAHIAETAPEEVRGRALGLGMALFSCGQVVGVPLRGLLAGAAGWRSAFWSRLRIAVAHRVGTTAPTVAARRLATLDRLSGGRAAAHVIIGSSDLDVARDGDLFGKEDRYRRAGEYLDLFTRYLRSEEEIDHTGEFYAVRGARPGLRPEPGGELVSLGGSSPQGVDLAARYAEVYAIAPLPLPDTRRRIAGIRAAAARHGRTLRIWRHVTAVPDDTDEAARERVRRLRGDALRLTGGPDAGRWAEAVQLDRDRERGRADPHGGTEQVAGYIRRSLAAALTGSPATLAHRIGLLRSAGVDIVQLDLPMETDHDRELRRALVARLRTGVAPAARRGW
ncbi:LLM class flavin-dependent oxidoreductase [Peterkaempfera sp. SMS 1(5)a]|uniref:LLM class flavin-dependent oxidoreductase n=1 Tax=Peterkaempfera podocarpi TaxID=3232308 RepID=UPI003670F6E0